MDFVWENTKNKINIKKHGIDFADAVQMFYYQMLTCVDRRKDYKEERWVGIGVLKGIIAVIVYTEDEVNDIIRIFSVRKATSYESKKYKENVKY